MGKTSSKSTSFTDTASLDTAPPKPSSNVRNPQLVFDATRTPDGLMRCLPPLATNSQASSVFFAQFHRRNAAIPTTPPQFLARQLPFIAVTAETPQTLSACQAQKRPQVIRLARQLPLTVTSENSPQRERNLPRLTQICTPETRRITRRAFQAHHVIPRCIWNTFHRAMTIILKLDMNRKFNLVSLPTGRLLPVALQDISTPSRPELTLIQRQQTSTVHRGSHSQQYMTYIRTTLRTILQQLERDYSKINIKRIRAEIISFVEKTKQELLLGTRALN